ncbi:MAG: hypothetical protein AAFR47_06815 [Pseudomonadota bacterium]
MVRIAVFAAAAACFLGSCTEQAPLVASNIATFSAPSGCQFGPTAIGRSGDTTRQVSGCSLVGTNATTDFVLKEGRRPADAIPQGLAAIASGNAAERRAVVMQAIMIEERVALASSPPGWAMSNTRADPLPGTGGVPGADACLRYAFDARSGGVDARSIRSTGLRCGRLVGGANNEYQTVLFEVLAIRPAGAPVPAGFRSLERQATGSLRFR